MPRNVRNFWITAEIDGRAGTLEGGPVARDGGFDLTIKQRDAGEVMDRSDDIDIMGRANSDGTLTLRIWHRGELVFERITTR